MAGYIYLPIPTAEMKNFAKDFNDGRAEKGKAKYPVVSNPHVKGPLKGFRRRVGLGCLRSVTAGKLYIIVHGSAKGSKFVGASRSNNVLKKYTPDELADVIEAEGLLKSFVDLRLFACGSGLAPDATYGPYGQRLAGALRNNGYNGIQVTGYEGALYSAYSIRQDGIVGYTTGKHKGVVVEGSIDRASAHKRVF